MKSDQIDQDKLDQMDKSKYDRFVQIASGLIKSGQDSSSHLKNGSVQVLSGQIRLDRPR